MSALLLGSISTVADTSELQRQAFNDAFTEHGLEWHWDRDEYLRMLESSGGEKRIADYAESLGTTVDAGAVHRSKTHIFQRILAESRLSPRPGVVETIRAAKDKGSKVALVTTTSADNVASLMDALTPELRMSDFDLVVDASHVAQPKPDKAAYSYALETLGETARACVAVEDNLQGVEAAAAAGLACVAFPNQNTAGSDFPKASRIIDRMDFDELQEIAPLDA